MTELIVALDCTIKQANHLVAELIRKEVWYKVGPQILYQESGFDWALDLAYMYNVFFDVKLHDIPYTVEKSCNHLANGGAASISVHHAVGSAMRGVEGSNTQIWHVQRLSSSPQVEMEFQDYGAHGIIVPPYTLNGRHPRPKLIVPGIRMGHTKDDHAMTITPKQAKSLGVDFIVMGRPILEDPSLVDTILEELNDTSI